MNVLEMRIIEYLKDHCGASLHDIAPALNETEMKTGGAIHALLDDGYIEQLEPQPLPPDNPGRGTRYKVTKKGLCYIQAE